MKKSNPVLYCATWNVQGQSVKDLENASSELDLSGLDFLGLQELGGCPSIARPWEIIEVWVFRRCMDPLCH